MGTDRQRLAVLIAFAVTCALWGARTLVDPDAIGLVLAIDQQDLRIHQPPPPGFILYVWFARFTDAWIDDPWLALRVVAVLALGAASVLTARSAARVAGARAGAVALVTFLSSPLVLFHGMTASSFPGGALVAALALCLCLGALQRRAASFRLESYLIALCAGLRAQALLIALPLWVWTLARLPMRRRERGLAVVAWLAGTVCWLVPQAKLSGSLSKYVAAAWESAWAARPVGGVSGFVEATQWTAVTLLCGLGVLRVVGMATLRVLPRTRPGHAPSDHAVEADTPDAAAAGTWRAPASFWLVAILPTLVWALVLSRPTAGALLVLWPPLCIAFASAAVTARSRARRGLVGAVLALDLALFFLVPVNALRDTPRLFERIEFFHERVRSPTLSSVPDTLLATGIADGDALVLSTRPADRALAYTHPETYLVHVEERRPVPRLLYHERRARALSDTYEVDDAVRWVVVHGRVREFSRAQNPLLDAWPTETRGALHLFHVGGGPIDAWYVPETTRGAVLRLHLVRGLPPSDPEGGALQRAERALEPATEERDVAATH